MEDIYEEEAQEELYRLNAVLRAVETIKADKDYLTEEERKNLCNILCCDKEELSYSDMLNKVVSEDSFFDDIQHLLEPGTVANLISFEDSEKIAYHLVYTHLREAEALFNELRYYHSLGRI